MFLSSVVNSGSLPVLERMAAFTEARHRVLLTNVANLDTPGYRPKDVDPDGFRAALSEASGRRGGSSGPLEMAEGKSWRFGPGGSLEVRPREVGPENILFHDRTNSSVERQMSELVKNAMMHQIAVELLRGRYSALMTAIRGRVA